jgi:hypothetical protein
VYIQDSSIHELEPIKIRVCGNQRKDLAKDLQIKGTLNVQSEHIVFNRDDSDVKGNKKYFFAILRSSFKAVFFLNSTLFLINI